MKRPALVACLSLFAAGPVSGQPAPITIRAGTIIDGKGQVHRNAAIVVENSRIVRMDASAKSVTYDFPALTLLPGLIDTHVHIGSHFGKEGRASNAGETPAQAIL
jgi:imidazolonepropionase-like amidohydrolase